MIHFYGIKPTVLDVDINPWFIPERKVKGFELVSFSGNVNFEEAKEVKRPSTGNTLKPVSLGQMVVAKAVAMKHVRHSVARTHPGPADELAGRSESERWDSAVMQSPTSIGGRVGAKWECLAYCAG